MNLPSFARAFAVVAGLFTLAGCQAIDSTVDCNTICTRYHDCFDGSYDVKACNDRCRSNATASDMYYVKVNNCEACIDDKACASAAFGCAAKCGDVVP